MPDQKDLLAAWIQEAKTEIKEGRDKCDKLDLRLTTLEAEVKTRNNIVWALIGVVLAAAGVVVALLQHLKSVT